MREGCPPSALLDLQFNLDLQFVFMHIETSEGPRLDRYICLPYRQGQHEKSVSRGSAGIASLGVIEPYLGCWE